MNRADGGNNTPGTQTPILLPGVAQDAFFLPTPTNSIEYDSASAGSLRQAVEAQIETLLAFLDFIDIDPDLEATTAPDDREGDETDDEPSLGWAEAETQQDVSSHVGGFGFVDGELDPCDDEDGHDAEMMEGRPVPTTAGGRLVRT